MESTQPEWKLKPEFDPTVRMEPSGIEWAIAGILILTFLVGFAGERKA